jgi:predicted metal-dependent enzyme (double-stranded beta helix superfamily)
MGSESWEWPDSMDALTASAEHHTILLENDLVRVVQTLVPPGERTNVHTHRWAGVLHVLSWSDFIRYDADGNVMLDSKTLERIPEPGTVSWALPLVPHSFHNVGTTEFRAIAVEVKSS